MQRPAAARPDLPEAAPKRRGVFRRPAAAPESHADRVPAEAPEPQHEAPVADADQPAEPPSFDHKGCSKCKKKGHGCARCKPFATQGIKGYFWLDGEVVRKIP